MLIDSEEKLKIAVLAAVAVALLCDGQLSREGFCSASSFRGRGSAR